jgi:hypothetical protein
MIGTVELEPRCATAVEGLHNSVERGVGCMIPHTICGSGNWIMSVDILATNSKVVGKAACSSEKLSRVYREDSTLGPIPEEWFPSRSFVFIMRKG